MTGVVWAVIRREYLQRVRTKWFVLGTLAMPVLMSALVFIPAYFASQESEASRSLMILDLTGELAADVAPRLEVAGFRVVEVPPGIERPDQVEELVRDEVIAGFLLLDNAALERGAAVFTAREAPSPLRQLALRQSVVQSAVARRLGGDDEQVQALLRGGELDVELTSGEGVGGFEEPAFLVAYLGAFMLYMTILLYAVAVMRSVLEEKTTRVVEVIISSIRPFQLMLGKIVGVGAVGLTQLAIWSLFGVLLATFGLPVVLATNPDAAALTQVLGLRPLMGTLGLFLVFFIGGYFMYSGLYAAVGAMCNAEEEAQQAQLPVILLMMIPIVFVTPVIQDPDATFATVLSLFPLFSPVLMYARAAGGGAPAWQVGASLVGMALAVLAIAWLAGRIYKVGILMTGKRPTLPELWRWVREA